MRELLLQFGTTGALIQIIAKAVLIKALRSFIVLQTDEE
jgi:hypothetical protein